MSAVRHFKVWLGGAILLMLFICGVAAPLLSPHDPQAQILEDRLRPPRWAENGSPAYLLGTDNLGRDMLSRIIYGSRISLLVGVAGLSLSVNSPCAWLRCRIWPGCASHTRNLLTRC